jgi:alkanesulfonate monooxygenase
MWAITRFPSRAGIREVKRMQGPSGGANDHATSGQTASIVEPGQGRGDQPADGHPRPAKLAALAVQVFSTSPQSRDGSPGSYLDDVRRAALWSEAAGCTGTLVYADNGVVDPWLVAQAIIAGTNRLCPLVAVQPVYMHPYAVAKMVATLGFLHGRRVFLNMVAGGFANDLAALDDATPHDRRYERLYEYTWIVQELLQRDSPLTFAGAFYRVEMLKLHPRLDDRLAPGIFVSGSSEAGLIAARRLSATAIHYPRPPRAYDGGQLDPSVSAGIRVGIVARASHADAWSEARRRFPPDRKGQLLHQLSMRTSDSKWHEQLSRLAAQADSGESIYWLAPFENYQTNCPYLVGDYLEVAAELTRFVRAGCRTLILDIPPSEAEFEHTSLVLAKVLMA